MLENLAASLGPGIVSTKTNEEELMKHVLLSRSPTESLLAFCEVMTNGCMDEYEVSY